MKFITVDDASLFDFCYIKENDENHEEVYIFFSNNKVNIHYYTPLESHPAWVFDYLTEEFKNEY
jgi:hypothetical protein